MENSRLAQRPEHQIILSCARTRLDSGQAQRLLALLDQPLDWTCLVAKALRHRVTCLLYWNLQAVARELVPPEWMHYLREYFEENAYRNLVLTRELLDIIRAFQAGGILTVPYHGPVLAALAYGNLALREFVDLDLVCPSEYIPRACEQLMALGYQPGVATQEALKKSSPGVPGQYPFSGKGGRLIELHSERTLHAFPAPLNLKDLMVRLQPVPLGGKQVMSFSANDLLPMLCAHASRHYWARLCWICDVAELVQRSQALDWDAVFAQARRFQAERMVHVGLLLANTVLHAPLPEEVLGRVRSDRRAQGLSSRICRHLLRTPEAPVGFAARLLHQVGSQTTLLGGLRSVAKTALTPAEDDLVLPTWLTPLHPALRLWHLARKHGPGVGRVSNPDLAPYVPSPFNIVDRLLHMADLKPDDVLYDLGCGDGRIVVTAAKRFGIRAVGIEMDPGRVELARAAVLREGVAHLVKIVRQDAKTVDITEASVVTMYLTLPGNLALREKLLTSLRPGTRIVSRDFVMPAWDAEKVERFADASTAVRSSFYLYRVPNEHSVASASAGAPEGAARFHAVMESKKSGGGLR